MPFDLTMLEHCRRLAIASRRRGRSLFDPPGKAARADRDGHTLRDYAPGDDYRLVDWAWCARRDEILTKVYPPHVDRSTFLLIDCSRSMGQGTPSKFDLARRIAAILGYDALTNQRGLLAAGFSSRIVAQSPMRQGASGVAGLFRFLTDLGVQGDDTDLAAAAEGLSQATRRRGPLVILSDLLDRWGFDRGINLLLQQGFTPHVVQLFDPADAEPPCLGEVELVDVESGVARTTMITERAAAEYRRRVADFHRAVKEHARKRRLVCLQEPCHAAAEEVVAALSAKIARSVPLGKGCPAS